MVAYRALTLRLFKKNACNKMLQAFHVVNLPIPHTNLTVLVSQDFFTVRIRREVA
nr:MAG TPA: hypothetical protein [Caudoviricetes sp.]